MDFGLCVDDAKDRELSEVKFLIKHLSHASEESRCKTIIIILYCLCFTYCTM